MADPSPATADDREARIRQLLDRLRPLLEHRARQMAEALVDTPPEKLFGDIEYALRDHAHRLATDAHQVALDGDKKRATTGPAASAPTARPTPASSSTGSAPS
jgi:hypothetical protein